MANSSESSRAKPAASGATAIEPEPVEPDPPALPGRTVLRQRWADLAYFHWRYEPDEVQRLLPGAIQVDTFDGSAWVGVVPFVMRDVRLGPLPRLPVLHTFVEINVRTYVVDALGRRAVWFFSLDVPLGAIVGAARSAFALPYCWAPGARFVTDGAGRHRFEMCRRWPERGPSADIEFVVGEPIDEPDDLAHFLSARWALLTTRRGRVLRGPVRHPRWPLHELEIVDLRQDIVEAAGLPTPAGPPHAMCSPGVDVEIAWLQRTLPG